MGNTKLEELALKLLQRTANRKALRVETRSRHEYRQLNVTVDDEAPGNMSI